MEDQDPLWYDVEQTRRWLRSLEDPFFRWCDDEYIELMEWYALDGSDPPWNDAQQANR